MSAHSPTADVSVRPSLESDAAVLGEIQVAAWRATHADTLPEPVLESLDAETFADAWRTAIARPPSPRHRVLTACAGPQVVGFAALAPGIDGDPTGEVVELAVAREHQRQGHGSRLLAACTDILTSTGAAQARLWVIEGDAVREAFATSAGFGPIGVRRVLQVGPAEVTEIAWAAQLHD